MVDIEELVETYKEKIIRTEESERYDKEVIVPQVARIFTDEFMGVFEKISQTINQQIKTTVIKFKPEGHTRFSIEGRFHRVIFQRGKIEALDNIIYVNIIPLCIWKGVTKHLGPICFAKNLETGSIEWDLPTTSVEEYTKIILGKLAEDEDFYM